MDYKIPVISLDQLLPQLIRAEDQLARLDEIVKRSPAGLGFIERAHFWDAAASLWLAGELVHIEDLVLHDCGQDIRAPTNELVIAHKILRNRRRLAANPASWALSQKTIATLLGQDGQGEFHGDFIPAQALRDIIEDKPDDALAADMAKIDLLLDRSSQLIASLTNPDGTKEQKIPMDDFRNFEPEAEQGARLSQWLCLIPQLEAQPATLAAAILWEAWNELNPLPRQEWMGSHLISSFLRARGKVTSHLVCFNLGLKQISRERRRAKSRSDRLCASLEALAIAGENGMKEISRLLQQRLQLERKLKHRRSSSHLPALVEMLLSRPVISATMITHELNVSHRAALNLIAELDIKEITGRGRFQAWAVL